MILLQANAQLKEVFTRLIQTMKVNVEWTELFAVIDNYLILQGRVRSLFFNFENRKAVTNIIDLPVKEEDIVEIGDNNILPNVLNMTLYAFGKWGSLEGIRVDKDYAVLDELFTDILKEIHVKPDFNNVNYRFYKNNIRLTYEDVIQYAVEMKPEDELKEEEETEEALGLWHRVCWKRISAPFEKEDLDQEERASERIGSNFYLVGYQCPACGELMHMVMYPPEKEQLIETEEGGVYLSRAYTCSHCNRFYAAYPNKLLAEGEAFFLDFEADTKACEDYLELLGENGDLIPNPNMNRFAEKSEQEEGETEKAVEEDSQEETEERESIESAKTAERVPKEKRDVESEESMDEKPEEKRNVESENPMERNPEGKSSEGISGVKTKSVSENAPNIKQEESTQENIRLQVQKAQEDKHGVEPAVKGAGEYERKENYNSSARNEQQSAQKEEIVKKYNAKLNIFPRLSDMQVRELKLQIKNDKDLSEEERKSYFAKIEEKEQQKRFDLMQKKADACKDRNYSQISRVIEEIKDAKLPKERKDILLEPLFSIKKERAEKEVQELVKGLSAKMDRKRYRALREKLNEYEEVDASEYTKELDEAFDAAERQEIDNIVKRARKVERSDYMDLLEHLEKEGFAKEIREPYENKIRERIIELDQKAIDALLPSASTTFNETAAAYDAIASGVFLPELKINALEMLDKRLRKLKADECEQLVQKLKGMLKENIGDNDRIFYYPARKVLIGEADASQVERFNTAITIFAADKEKYEPPIVLFDTSKDRDGREGVLLSADHIFYGSRFDAGTIAVTEITKLEMKTGLLNKGLYVTQKNGAKTKLHYVVQNHEADKFGDCLQEFISYLQEKPQSRKIEYLAKEKHETICCLRCGYIYQEGNVCPKCGYKNN